MSKELIWSEESEFVYGLASDFNSEEEFIQEVKYQYEDGDCEVANIKNQPCIYADKGVSSGYLMPLASTDVVIENYYTAEVTSISEEELL